MQVEMQLKPPALLVAVPQLGDPNFSRSVVVLLEHGAEGSMGVVLSQPSDLAVATLCRDRDLDWGGPPGDRVHIGGPVDQDRAFILHSEVEAAADTQRIAPGLSLSYSVEALDVLAVQPPAEIRFFLGYAGWGPGQLATEFREGSWLLCEFDQALLFATPGPQAWEQTLAKMGIDPAQLQQSTSVH